jgi:urease accessory protein
MMRDPLALVRLLQLASPTLPIGAYSYSQGLEWCVESGTICDAASAQNWIGDLLVQVQSAGEAPVLWRLCASAARGDWDAFDRWHAWFRASRESSELLAETLQTGGSLARLLTDLDVLDDDARNALTRIAPVTLPAAYALAARALAVPTNDALTAYLWSWLENQVLAAMKTIPLGQVGGQKMLLALGAAIPAVVAGVEHIADDDVGSFAPGLAIASARHEVQYSRLFRS